MSTALLEEQVWALGGTTGHQQQTLCHVYPKPNHPPPCQQNPDLGVKILSSPRDEL